MTVEAFQDGMHCAEFEALLADGLDGMLPPQIMGRFDAHGSSCANCGPLFEAATQGRDWLKSLPEVDPPQYLVHNILAATSLLDNPRLRGGTAPALPGQEASGGWRLRGAGGRGAGGRLPGWMPEGLQTVFAGLAAGVMRPRFARSFAMAFFSITLMLNVAGIQMKDLRRLDLRPNAITRQFYGAQARVVKYYDNIRFVYEFQTRVQDLKKAATTEQGSDSPKNHGSDSSKKKAGPPEAKGSSQNDRSAPGTRQEMPARNLSPEGEGTSSAGNGKNVDSASKTIAPASKTVAPAGKTVAPAGKTVAPAGKIVAPAGKTVAPAGEESALASADDASADERFVMNGGL